MLGDEIQFWRAGEWTGVYVNGKLARHGDHYLADEWLQERCGVKIVDSDAWVPDGVQPFITLAEVENEEERRAALKIQAEGLRRQAEEMIREADKLEAQIKPGQS